MYHDIKKKKNVHAGVSGYAVDNIPEDNIYSEAHLTYNPYKYESFVDQRTEKPRWFASFVQLHPQEVRASAS